MALFKNKRMSLRGCVATVAISSLFLLASCGGDSGSNGSSDNESSEEIENDDSSSSCEDCEDDATSSSSAKTKSSSSVKKGSSSDSKGNDEESSSSKDPEESSSSEVCEQDSCSIDQPDEFIVISGVAQKGPFASGASVKLYEFDSTTYTRTDKIFTGMIVTNDGQFTISDVTLAGGYALFEVDGHFRNEITGLRSKAAVTLNALVDISHRKTVNINLLTHLEYERTLYLMSLGKDFVSAKEQAETEVLKAFEIKSKFASPEDLDIFGKGNGNAALLAMSVLLLRELKESELNDFLDNLSTDIVSDGVWGDEYAKAEIADWARTKDLARKFAEIRSNIEKWDLGTVPEFEKFVRNFWYMNYGLGECDSKNNAEVKASSNELTEPYGTQIRYICKDGAWIEATDMEKDFYLSGKDTGEDGEFWTGLVTEKKYKYDEKLGEWLEADSIDVILDNACVETRIGLVDGDENGGKYYCTANGWLSMVDKWSYEVPKEVRMNPEIEYGTMTDSRDEHTYKTVKIGNQVWMAENLNYADSSTTPSLLKNNWCYTYGEKSENCTVAGRYYTWAAAIDSVKLYEDYTIKCGDGETCTLPDTVYGICPLGWHLPTDAEWNTLITEVGGEKTAGIILKTQTGWDERKGGTDEVGFSAIPAGFREINGYFGNEGLLGYFWSATEVDRDNASNMYVGYYNGAYLRGSSKYFGYSVRCLQNEQ